MEQKQESEISNIGVVESNGQGSVGSISSGGVQGVINATTSSLTVQEFLETKLNNCKKFVETIECLKNTTLLQQFLKFQVRDILEYVIWISNSRRGIDTGLAELFAFHKIDINQLEKQQYEKLKLYFTCFQTVVQKQQ